VRRWFGIGVSILGVLAIVIVVSRSADGSSERVAQESRTSRQPGPSIAGDAAEVVRGDLNEPINAAIAAVAATGDVAAAGYISRRELIESFTTPEFGPTLADATSDQMRALSIELGARDAAIESMAVVERPISATAQWTAAGARVDVYSVLVVAVPDVGPARQVWRTVRLDLVERGGDWLVDAWESNPGPTPALSTEVAIGSASDVATQLSWRGAEG
jgi:hypothetical protein